MKYKLRLNFVRAEGSSESLLRMPGPKEEVRLRLRLGRRLRERSEPACAAWISASEILPTDLEIYIGESRNPRGVAPSSGQAQIRFSHDEYMPKHTPIDRIGTR